MIFLELVFVFFTIGLFTIGGGYAMIPMIQDQVVTLGWLTTQQILDFFAIAESTPGPFAVNTATLVGFDQGLQFGFWGGILGAVVTTLAVVLPSFIIIFIIAKYIHNFLKYKKVQWALNGVKSIVVGLLLAVSFRLINEYVLGGKYDFENMDFTILGIMAFLFILKQYFKKLSPILLIIISAAIGLIVYGLIPYLVNLL